MLACFLSFSAAAFMEPVPVSFVLTTAVLGAVTSTELPPKENINQIQKKEHSPGMGMTAERRLIFPHFLKGAQHSVPGLHLSCQLVSLHSWTLVPNLYGIICKSPISPARLYTEELSLTTDHNDFSFSWAKNIIPKRGRNCLSYKMSYMPLKLSFEFYLELLVLCKGKDLTRV